MQAWPQRVCITSADAPMLRNLLDEAEKSTSAQTQLEFSAPRSTNNGCINLEHYPEDRILTVQNVWRSFLTLHITSVSFLTASDI